VLASPRENGIHDVETKNDDKRFAHPEPPEKKMKKKAAKWKYPRPRKCLKKGINKMG